MRSRVVGISAANVPVSVPLKLKYIDDTILPPPGYSSWYRGSSIDQVHNRTLSDGASIGTWIDHGPDKRHATQSTGSKKPTFSSHGGRMNLGSLLFNAASSQVLSVDFSLETVATFTIGVLIRSNNGGVSQPIYVGGGQTTGSDYWEVAKYGDGSLVYRGTILYNPAVVPNDGATFCHSIALITGASSKQIIIGAEVTGDAGSATDSTRYAIGNDGVSSAANYWTGDIEEYLIYKSNKYTDLLTYFRRKTGLT